MLLVPPAPVDAENPARCDLGRNGELEDPKPKAEEEASTRKKTRGPPGLENHTPQEKEALSKGMRSASRQLANEHWEDSEPRDDAYMEEWMEHKYGLETADTILLRDTVLKETIVRCGGQVGRLVPVDECKDMYSVVTDDGAIVGKLTLYVDDVIMTGIGEWVEATMEAIGEGWDSKTAAHREILNKPMGDTMCEDCRERPATHIRLTYALRTAEPEMRAEKGCASDACIEELACVTNARPKGAR